MTSIYFLQESGEKPKWRRLKSDELFVLAKGSPMKIHLLDRKTGQYDVRMIGDPVEAVQLGGVRVDGFQYAVPAGTYFNTEIVSPKSYSLLICVVAPGFAYSDFKSVEQAELHDQFPAHKDAIDRFF